MSVSRGGFDKNTTEKARARPAALLSLSHCPLIQFARLAKEIWRRKKVLKGRWRRGTPTDVRTYPSGHVRGEPSRNCHRPRVTLMKGWIQRRGISPSRPVVREGLRGATPDARLTTLQIWKRPENKLPWLSRSRWRECASRGCSRGSRARARTRLRGRTSPALPLAVPWARARAPLWMTSCYSKSQPPPAVAARRTCTSGINSQLLRRRRI